jgi:hypothetical protein
MIRASQLRHSHRPARLVFVTVYEDADFARDRRGRDGLTIPTRACNSRAACSAMGKQTYSPVTGAVTIVRLLFISYTRALVGVGS